MMIFCVVEKGFETVEICCIEGCRVDCFDFAFLFFGGVAALIIAFCLGEQLPSLPNALGLMLVGIIVNGIANILLQYGQRYLGAAKTGAIDGLSPLPGILFAIPSVNLLAVLILFIPGMYFVITKSIGKTAEEKPA